MSHELTDFTKEVLERSHAVPVLVDFWAPWCGPCKMLTPIIEKLAAEADGRWALVKVNTEEHPDLARQYGISSIPNVKLFHRGEVVDEFVGALPETPMRRWLEKAIPSPHADALDQAEPLLRSGHAEEARRLLEPVVRQEPSNQRAAVLLAEAVLGVEPTRVETLVRAIGLDSEFADRATALRTLARFASLPDRAADLPDAPVRERYLEGARRLRAADYGGTLEALIDILQRQRDYDHGGAKEVGKSIFQLLGLRHPVSERYHRAFSSALHA